MYELPTTITVKDRQFHIRNSGDFRMVLDCFSALQDEELSEEYRILACLLIFYNEFNSVQDVQDCEEYVEELVHELFVFINCGQETSPGVERDIPLIDWENDSPMVCAAINNVAKMEIRAMEYLHWWTFLGYYMSVGESVLSTVVGIRDKIAHHKKLEKWEQDFKKSNPKYFIWRKSTVQDREAENLIRDLWNKGGG